MGEFIVGAARGYTKNLDALGNLTLTLDSKDITPLNSPRKNWTPDNLQDALIWIGGGGSYLINDQFLVLVRRSSNAPTNPGKLTLQTGMSDTEEEWIKPSLMKRELFEEVIILDHENQTFYYPDCDTGAYEIIQTSLQGTDFEAYQGKMTPSHWVSSIENDTIIVKTNHGDVVSKGLIHLKENHINLIFCCQIKDQIPLGKVNFFDSEFVMVNGSKKFLNREIYLYDLRNEQVLDLNSSAVCSMELTAHAEYFIKNIKNNWR